MKRVKDVRVAKLPVLEVGDCTIVHIAFAGSTDLTDQIEMIAVSVGEQLPHTC